MEALAATFVLGLASAASPCLLPLYPGFVAYLAGASPSAARGPTRWLLGLAVLAGLLTTMVALGVAIALLALPFTDILRWTVPAGAAVLVVLGIALLAGRNPFARLAGLRMPVLRHRVVQAYVYGLLAGPVALPCAGPFLVALLVISVGLADALLRVGSFVVYGLGFGLPLAALAVVGTARGEAVSRLLARHHGTVLRVSGVVLIVTAVYELVASGVL